MGVRLHRGHLPRAVRRRLPDRLARHRGAEASVPAAAGRRRDHRRPVASPSPAPAPTPPSMTTTAVRKGDRYVLNGSKMWVTNGSHAGVITLFATVDRGPRPQGRDRVPGGAGLPGLRARQARAQDGHPRLAHGGAAPHRLRGAGREPARRGRARGSGSRSGRSTARARPSAPRRSASRRRRWTPPSATPRSARQFDRPIAEFQGIQFMLADMAMQVHASRLLVHHAAALVDRGVTGTALEASMAKCFAADAAMKVATDAVQVFGGYGYTREFPVERFMRDAKITQIYEGTNQIQRVVIARDLLGAH